MRMLRSTGAFGLAAGPVPWIHWCCRSWVLREPRLVLQMRGVKEPNKKIS